MQTTGGGDLDNDVLIIGGGPAGPSAALQLGRSRRSVLVCDTDEPRNGPAAEVHGYLTRDGIAPQELRRLGRKEVANYGGEFQDSQVTDITRDEDGFISTLDTSEMITSRKVVFVAGDASNGSSLSVPSAVTDGSEVGATVNIELAEETFEEERKNEREA